MRRPRLEVERLAASGSLTEAVLQGTRGTRKLFPRGSFELPEAGSERRFRDGDTPLPIDAFRVAGTASRERLEAVLRGRGLLISTGQQPQLFGGPMYVLYKALTAIRLAIEAENALGLPCLALFWVASDDHDWREVASVGVLDSAEDLVRFELNPPAGWEDRPVGPAPLPDEVTTVVRSMTEALAPTEQGREWVEHVLESYVPGASFSEAFADLVSTWLRDLPIVYLDSADRHVRQASRTLFQEVLMRHEEVLAALEQGARAVRDLGFTPQLSYLDGASPIFRDGATGRRRLYVAGRRVLSGRDGKDMALDALLEELDAAPGRFSPAAALRPVLESCLLPVSASVLGPGEIAYWAQLQPLFAVLDVPMPRIRPRTSWRVIEPKVDRLLDRTGLPAAELEDGGQRAVRDLVERNRPAAVEEAIDHIEASLASGFSRLEEVAEEEVPGLRSAVGKARSQVESTMDGFRRTLDSRIRDREHTLLEQVRRIARNVYPAGGTQERAVSPLVFLAKYGGDFLEVVRAEHSL